MKPIFTAQRSQLLRATSTCAVLILACSGAHAQQTAPASDNPARKSDETTATDKVEGIVITGTRIKAAGLTSTSPVSQITAEELALARAVTVEDFSVKLPQLAGGGLTAHRLAVMLLVPKHLIYAIWDKAEHWC